MSTMNKQETAIAALVAAGLITTGTALLLGRSTEGNGSAREVAEHTGSAGHQDREHHGEPLQGKHEDAVVYGDQERHDASKKGSHGGNVYAVGDVTVKFGMAEDGGEPKLKLWVTRDGKSSVANISASGAIKRVTGESMPIGFKIMKDSLESEVAIAGPHVFDAAVPVMLPDVQKPMTVAFSKEGGKTELTVDQIAKAGVGVEIAGVVAAQPGVQFLGEIRLNEDRTAHVVPRLTGVVEHVSANIGEQVKSGQVLAVIASTVLSEQRSELLVAQRRLSLAQTTYAREKCPWEEKISAEQDHLQTQMALQEARIAMQNAQQKLVVIGAAPAMVVLNRFGLRTPLDGMVVEKHLAIDGAIKEDANVFMISDLSSVWAEFAVVVKDLGNVRIGQQVTTGSTAFDSKATGLVSHVGLLLGEQTRTAKAHVVLTNPDMIWRPGLFVMAQVLGPAVQVPVAARADATQEVNGKPATSVAVPGGFVAQPVKTGRSIGKVVEITKDLGAGARYATASSFVLRAELGKANAEYEH